jgi:hypothetical protein
MQTPDDPAAPYPWIYTPSPWAKAGLVVCGLFGVAMAIGCVAWVVWRPEPFWVLGLKAFIVGVGAFMGFAGLYTGACAFLAKNIITAHEITRQDFLKRKTIRKSTIVGYRIINVENNFSRVRFQTRGADRKHFDILLIRPDEKLMSWISSLTDLDEVDRQKAEAKLLADSSLGETVQARRGRLARFKRIAQVANWLGIAILGWSWFWPKPYALAVAASAIAPIAALALIAWSRGAIAFEKAKADMRPDLSGLFFAGMILGLRALLDVNLVLWSDAILPAGVIALAAYLIQRSLPLGERIGGFAVNFLTVGLCLYYGWGAAIEANMLRDQGATKVFKTRVLSKRISGGRSTSYYLELAPWGPRAKADEVSTVRATYDRFKPGDPVCVYLYPGALNIRWFELGTCPAPNRP